MPQQYILLRLHESMGKYRKARDCQLTRWVIIVVGCLIVYTCLKNSPKDVTPQRQLRSIKYSLITSYSFAIYPEHLKEMDYCILQNLMTKDLHVWVLLDHPTPTRQCEHLQEKLQRMSTNIKEWTDAHWSKFHCQYRVGKQPSYYDLVQYASTLPSEYIILSNGDIIFDDTIDYATNLQAGQAYAISWSSVKQKPAWLGIEGSPETSIRGSLLDNSMCLMPDNKICSEKQKYFVINCWPKRLFSIDSFIAHREIFTNLNEDGFREYDKEKREYVGYFYTNWPGSEHSFVGVLVAQGRKVINACKHIKTSHMHYAKKNLKNHRERVLYSKYGIYSTEYDEVMNKAISYDNSFDEYTYPLPLGI